MQYSSNTRLAPSNFRGIVLLATAESQVSIHALLHTLHVFKDVTSIPPPPREARKDIRVAETSLRKKRVLMIGAGMVALTYSLSTSQYAAAFGARGTPSIMRFHGIMGIEANQSWSVCSLNDYRKFLGLKTHTSFSEWNPDRNIAEAANNLELYAGIQAEGIKPLRESLSSTKHS